VSAPTGFVAALKTTLRHCGPRASGTAVAGRPARVQASEGVDHVGGRRARLERPEGRVALHLPADVTGLDEPAGRERRAADHALDVARDRLLVADAVLDGGDGAPLGER